MSSGLIQLVAYGAQDIYLTGNPQITFFKAVHRRHTNFAMEAIEQTLLGPVGFGSKFTVTVSRNGDLVHRVLLEVDLPALTFDNGTDTILNANTCGWVNWIGHRLINEVTVEIGGQPIDKQNTNFMWAWDQLTEGDNEGFMTMVGSTGKDCNGGCKLYIPLKIWFSDNLGLSLPLIALQYHDVRISVTFNKLDDLVEKAIKTRDAAGKATEHFKHTAGDFSCKLYVDYIYLDKHERRKFAQHSHEYLITQTQDSGNDSFSGCAKKIRLHFNHPVKELIWLVNEDCGTNPENWYKFKTVKNAVLLLNNQERFSKRDGGYFTLVQPWQHHSNIPADENVHVYSFAANPEELQPSGSCNMSRIDNTTLSIEMAEAPTSGSYVVNVYARNYNVLRVMHGMGGAAYSN